MSGPNDVYNTGPASNQPEGVNPYGDEQTLPFVDLYSPSGNLADPPTYGEDAGHWGPYGPATYGGGQYPHQQNSNPYYQPNPYVNPSPYQTRTPQPLQYGYYGYAPVEHPQSTTVLVLGLLGFVLPVTSFVAWYMGSKAKDDIQRGAPYPYSGSLKVGHVIGKILSILMLVGAGAYALVMLLVVLADMAF